MKYQSQLVTNASGSVKGLTASRNSYGQYFRGRVTPSNPSTGLQMAARASFAAVSAAWRSLSKVLQQAWKDAAGIVVKNDPLGEPITLTGQAAYMSINRRQTTAGLATFTTPPASVNTQPVFSTATGSRTNGQLGIVFASAPPTGGRFAIFAFPKVLGPGQNFAGPATLFLGTASATSFDGNTASANSGMAQLAQQIKGSAANAQIAIAAYTVDTTNAPSGMTETRVPLA